MRQAELTIAVIWLLSVLAVNGTGSAKAPDQPAQLLWEGWHTAPAPALTRYRVFQNKVVELANLTKPCGLGSESATIEGKVVRLQFDDSGIAVIGFVLEESNGSRSFVNVHTPSISDDGMDMADLGWIEQGLQTLLRPGTYIQGAIQRCGAAGRVLALDAVRPAATASTRSADQTNNSRSISAHAEIALVREHGTLKVPVVINGILTLNFTVDSGASDVSIPADVVMVMMRTGTLTSADFYGTQTYRLADGSVVPSKVFRIRALMVGDRVIENVTGSMSGVEGSLLLGQSFLGRFASWSIDNERQVLVLQ